MKLALGLVQGNCSDWIIFLTNVNFVYITY